MGMALFAEPGEGGGGSILCQICVKSFMNAPLVVGRIFLFYKKVKKFDKNYRQRYQRLFLKGFITTEITKITEKNP